MRSRPFRAFALVATIALIVGACGSSTASNPPAAASGGASAAPTITIAGGTAAPGQVDIRWYCCLGGGDAPEQVAVEKKVIEAFNASHDKIHVTFEAVPYAYFGQYSPAFAARKSLKNLDAYWGIPTLWALDK